MLGWNSLLSVSESHIHRAHDQTPQTWPFANGPQGSQNKVLLGASTRGAGTGVEALLPLGPGRAQTEQGGGRAGPFLQDGGPEMNHAGSERLHQLGAAFPRMC